LHDVKHKLREIRLVSIDQEFKEITPCAIVVIDILNFPQQKAAQNEDSKSEFIPQHPGTNSASRGSWGFPLALEPRNLQLWLRMFMFPSLIQRQLEKKKGSGGFLCTRTSSQPAAARTAMHAEEMLADAWHPRTFR